MKWIEMQQGRCSFHSFSGDSKANFSQFLVNLSPLCVDFHLLLPGFLPRPVPVPDKHQFKSFKSVEPYRLTFTWSQENPKDMSIIIPRDKKNNTLESVDMISALPDSILGVILSLLPTKNVVATSTLSKRWEFMWRTVHNLDFCFEFLGDTVEQLEDENKKFIGFVNHVLLHHDAGVLNKFRLEWAPACIQSHVTSWIKTAITRNVHELSLNLESLIAQFDTMPISIFSCDSLRSLELEGRNICLSATTMFRLPRLERLDLNGVTFQSDEALEKIIRGCPMLNDLRISIKGDQDDIEFRFIISSTSLKRLELVSWCYMHLMLEASSLEHLRLSSYCYAVFVLKNLSSLVEADFEIWVESIVISDADESNTVVDAVSALDSAKILTLSECVMRALCCATINLSTYFNRLVKLETTIYCCDWSSLQELIQSSNNLEVLTIVQLTLLLDDENDHDHSNWTTPIEVPRCLSTSLKKVYIHSCNGSEDEHDMICYMLKYGSVLEVMHLSSWYQKGDDRLKLLQEACVSPRNSPVCKVQFFFT